MNLRISFSISAASLGLNFAWEWLLGGHHWWASIENAAISCVTLGTAHVANSTHDWWIAKHQFPSEDATPFR